MVPAASVPAHHPLAGGRGGGPGASETPNLCGPWRLMLPGPSTGALTARGMPGALFPWRGPCEGEPAGAIEPAIAAPLLAQRPPIRTDDHRSRIASRDGRQNFVLSRQAAGVCAADHFRYRSISKMRGLPTGADGGDHCTDTQWGNTALGPRHLAPPKAASAVFSLEASGLNTGAPLVTLSFTASLKQSDKPSWTAPGRAASLHQHGLEGLALGPSALTQPLFFPFHLS
jgi:hypothetical protein